MRSRLQRALVAGELYGVQRDIAVAPLWSALWDPEDVRCRTPRDMAPLTHLRLFVGTGSSVTRWDTSAGWQVLSYEE
jgi:hypothetical protein